ncbi:MAG: hypothetical protein WD990_11550 [Acidimicrobiia bacterium]
MSGLEHAISHTLRWLLAFLLLTPLLLAVPTPHGSTPWILFHLSVIVTGGLALTMSLVPLLREPWFPSLGAVRALLASAASVVVLVTGAVGLVTLASSAALRLDPSLQFLQLLSALDIAWVVGATAIGATLLRGRPIGWLAGAMMVSVCVWSVATYLVAVGYTPSGGWLVDGEAMWRYILPYDMAAAVIALTTLGLGVRARATEHAADQPMAQPSPQS